MGHWNHRVISIDDVDEGKVLTFAEVHYRDDGTPVSWAWPFTYGESKDDLALLLDRFRAALDKDVLDAAGIKAKGDSDGIGVPDDLATG